MFKGHWNGEVPNFTFLQSDPEYKNMSFRERWRYTKEKMRKDGTSAKQVAVCDYHHSYKN